MAGKHVKMIMDQVECAVCLETLRDPRILPCPGGGHTLCKRCLEGLVRGSTITCPLDRTQHAVPPAGVDGFTRVLGLAGIIEGLCRACRKAFPETRCTHCDKDVCAACQVSHLSFKDLKEFTEKLDHVIQYSKRESKVRSSPQGHLMHKAIDEKLCKLIQDLEEKRVSLREKVDRLQECDAVIIQKWKQELDMKISEAEQYLAATTTQLGDEFDDHITDKEMADLKAQCQDKITELQSSIDEAPSWTKLVLDCDTAAVDSAIAALGSVYAVGRDGEPLRYGKPRVIGKRGSRPGEFDIAVCHVTGHVAVADHGNHRVQVLDADLRHITDIRACGGGQMLQHPAGVAVNSRKEIIVSDYLDNSVYVYSHDGAYLRQLQGPGSYPWGLTVDRDDNTYVNDLGRHGVRVLDNSGKLIRTFGGQGTEAGKFSNYPMYTTLCQGNVVVSDNGGKIHEFSRSGDFIRNIVVDDMNARGLATRGTSELVIVDRSGPITVRDGDHTVTRVGELGDQPWQLNKPLGVAVIWSGQIIVANTGHDNVLVYDPIN